MRRVAGLTLSLALAACGGGGAAPARPAAVAGARVAAGGVAVPQAASTSARVSPESRLMPR